MASQYTKTELVDIARKNKVKGYSTKNKDELYKILVEGGYLGSARPTKKTSPKGRGRKAYSPKGKKKASPKRKSRSPRRASPKTRTGAKVAKPMKDYSVAELREILGCGGTKKVLYDQAMRKGLLGKSPTKASSEDKLYDLGLMGDAPIEMKNIRQLYRNGEITRDEVQKILDERWHTDNDVIFDGELLHEYLEHKFIEPWLKETDGMDGIIYYDISSNWIDGARYGENKNWEKEMKKKYNNKDSDLVILFAK